jgi:RNA polymerase sigma factor for flagellar operon FliA
MFISLDELNDSDAMEITDEEPNQAEDLEKNELKENLVNAVQQLPEQQRIIILLYYYEELTFKEIGSILHLTESRVAQIHKAVIELMRATVRSIHGRTLTAGV